MWNLGAWPDPNPPAPPGETDMSDTPNTSRKNRKGFYTGLFAGGLLTIGALGTAAVAATGGPAGWHGPCGGEITVEAVEARMQRGAGFLLDEVDATDAQRDAVDQLIADTAPELVEHRLEGQALRNALLDELAQETVDPDAIAQLRTDGLQLIDDGSAAHLDSLLALSAILDPDQRQELVDLANDWHGR